MHKIITWTTRYDLDRRETEKFMSEEITYDVNGRILDQTLFRPSGEAEHRMIYRYSDISDNLLEQVEWDFLNGLIERREFFEDEEGEIYKTVTTFNNGTCEIKEFSFSDLGKADRALIRDENGELLGEEIFAFDDEDNPVLEIEKIPGGIEVLRIERDFSPGGLLSAERVFKDGELAETLTYRYNVFGSPVVRIRKNSAGAIIESEVTSYNDENIETGKRIETHSLNDSLVEERVYDDAGNEILIECFRAGRLAFRNACTYDENGELTREEVVEMSPGGKVLRHEKLEHHFEGQPTGRKRSQLGARENYGD